MELQIISKKGLLCKQAKPHCHIPLVDDTLLTPLRDPHQQLHVHGFISIVPLSACLLSPLRTFSCCSQRQSLHVHPQGWQEDLHSTLLGQGGHNRVVSGPTVDPQDHVRHARISKGWRLLTCGRLESCKVPGR